MRLSLQTWIDNPILRAISTPVKAAELHKYRVLAETMLAYVKNPKNGWIGLAAPQVGVNKRIIVVGLAKDREDETYPLIIMINPVLTKKSVETSIDEEWCLSLPGIKWDVERPSTIEVEWVDIRGKKMRKTVTGLGAKVVQHEIDHIDGILISDKFLK